jgi:hypothetical protein
MNYTLQVEGLDLIVSPSEEEVVSSIESLTPDGGPGFLILESSNGDYMQSAGGNGRYLVEFRKYSEGGFTHCCAGNLPENTKFVEIPTNGFCVQIQENEVLAQKEVKTIFIEFLLKGYALNDFRWRDKSEEFI